MHRRRVRVGDRLAMALEKHAWLRGTLLNFVLLGTCALIGDGILTPAISGTCQQPGSALIQACHQQQDREACSV